MSKFFSLLTICLVLFMFSSKINSQYDYWCDNVESENYKNAKEALMSLYTNTNGYNWYVNDNWGNSTTCICDWMFVDCTSTGDKLINLFLTENNLKGKIPESFYKYDNFNKLFFSINSLSGNISESIGNMSKLTVLHLQLNKLEGEIPSELKDLNLVDLNLSSNKLGGHVPDYLYDSTDNLPEKISISGNEFWCNYKIDSYQKDGMPSWCDYSNATNYQCSPCYDGYPECRELSECACHAKSSCCQVSWSSESHRDTCEIAASDYSTLMDKNCSCDLSENNLPWYLVTLIIAITIFGMGCIVGSGGFAIHYITQKHFEDFSWSNIKRMIGGDKGESGSSSGYNLASTKVEYDFNEFDEDDDDFFLKKKKKNN